MTTPLAQIENVVVTADFEEFGQMSLAEFLEVNEFEPEEEAEIVAVLLEKGEYLFGGGAAPEILVKVVSN